ncbi:aldehyde dehydrogenase family protein [Arthrobacter sp. NPDC089319]|uniref:aldehyde dehydrogenase family protein n=1 Tax=Arthrobacter sp. NPDC089319 TaxID=3155915 RepID=UPI00342D3618
MTAIATEKSSLTLYPMHIGGERVQSSDGSVIDVLNPATEEAIFRVPQGNAEDAARAALAARQAFDNGPWPRMTPKERQAVLYRMVDIMERRKSELVDINVAECGSIKSFAESGQVGGAIAHLRDTADSMDRVEWEEPSRPHFGNGIGQGLVLREAYGVAALISAYNFPLWLNITKLAPALAAGCTVVLKPASTTPLEGLILADIGEEAGLPAGVLNVITGGRAATYELTTNPNIDMVSFTGSDEVGKQIYAQATSTLKKVVLELGGKSANIITEDANLEAVADEVAVHTIKHSGQGCSLLMRTLVHRSRHDELVELVKQRLENIQVGDPMDPESTMGPLISADQRERVEALIEAGVEEGARVVFGGKRPQGLERGYYLEPTLFVDVDNSMRIAREEFFGPVNVVIPFDTDEEAVQLANDNPYGLSAAVHAKDPLRAYSIARRLRTGGVVINGGGGAFPNTTLPFGGYKASGLGREYGRWGIDEYLQSKSISWGISQG